MRDESYDMTHARWAAERIAAHPDVEYTLKYRQLAASYTPEFLR